MSEQETVRVRIPVFVWRGDDGHPQYAAEGWNHSDDHTEHGTSLHDWDAVFENRGRGVMHYVEADVPVPVLPKPDTVEGEVVDA